MDLDRFELATAACDEQPFAVNEDIRYFLPCAVVNRRNRSAGDKYSGT